MNNSVNTAARYESSWQPTSPNSSALRALLGLGVLGLLSVSLYFFYDFAALVYAAIGVGLPVGWLLWKKPELGLITLVFLTSGFVPANALDVRLPVGGLDVGDLTLLGLASILLASSLYHKQLSVPWRRSGAALATFLVVALLSVIYAIFVRNVEPNWALSELRTVAYYATFFLITMAIRSRNQLAILLAGMFVIADLTAGTLIMQQFFGRDNPILAAMSGGNWNVWTSYQLDPTFANTQVLRIIPPGHVLTYVMSIVAFCLVVSEGSGQLLRIFFAAQFAYLNVGLIFTYERAQWVASVIALAIVILLLPGRAKVRVTLYGLCGFMALTIGFGVIYSGIQSAFGSQVLIAVQARADSILNPEATLASNSLEWRLFETDQATKSIAKNPILGVGLGARYRPPTSLQGESVWGIRDAYRFTRFIHDSYLYIAVKMGVVGFLSFLAFVATLLWTGLRQIKRVRDGQLNGTVLALLASFVGLMMWAVTQAHFLQTESTTVIGIMAGIIAVVDQLDHAPPLTESLEVPNREVLGLPEPKVM